MAVSHVAAFGSNGTAQATNKAFTMPASVVAGDYALAALGCTAGSVITPPTGWVLIGTYVNGNLQVNLYHKLLASADASAVQTFTSDISQRISITGAAYRSTKGAVVAQSREETVSATSHAMPLPSAPSTDSVVAVTLVAEMSPSGTLSTSVTQPSGYTLRWQSPGSGGTDATIMGWADKLATSVAAGAAITGANWVGNQNNAVVETITLGLSENSAITVGLSVTSSTPAQQNQDVTLTAVPSDGGAVTHQYTFTFGDGTTAGPQTSPVATHKYTSANLYRPSVKVS